MDYKEKYKQALEKATIYHKQGNEDMKLMMETCFPELKESEDEKIRKGIFKALSKKDARDVLISQGIEVSDALAWLEKQGEQKPAWSEEEERYIRQLESMVKERWALAEKVQDEEVIKNMSNLAFFLKTLNPNKKPTDEEMKTLLRTEYAKGRADAIAEMQKEWSEEDEVKINRIVACLENLNVADNDILLKDVDWLKSLRPQNRWKPSDGQMEALDFAANCIVPAEFCIKRKVLKELSEQLKKLKED